MQLRSRRHIRGAVTAITAALLGTGVAGAAEQNRAETSILLYSEKNRVTTGEGVLALDKQLRSDLRLSLKLTYDGLTGATPMGATPSRKVQTFTRPSGNGSFTIQPGKTPLDDTFHDTRFAIDAGVSKPLSRLTNASLGGHFSNEFDYQSYGVNAGLTRDFNRKNTTVGVSWAYSHDKISPVGGAPTPFSSLPTSVDSAEHDDGNEDDDHEHEGAKGPNKTKDVLDVVVGVSQVIDRNTIFRMNYSYSHLTGYMNDPYKVLSIVQDRSSAEPGEPVGYVYEGRPDKRNKHAIYGEIRRYLSGHTVDLSYRYFWDDWGIRSHTADFYFLWQTKSGKGIQPHVRWYHQGQADFYRLFLDQSAPLVKYVSADYRLAKFDALTLGLQLFIPVNAVSKLSIAGEYYTQRGDNSPPEAFGSLVGMDLFPKMDAFMLRLGYVYNF